MWNTYAIAYKSMTLTFDPLYADTYYYFWEVPCFMQIYTWSVSFYYPMETNKSFSINNSTHKL